MASLHEMQSVDLEYVRIGADGAAMLANGLKTNTSVTSINLWDNKIGAESASALANALKVNTALTNVSVCSNRSATTVHRRLLTR
jgi:hypothetical protein